MPKHLDRRPMLARRQRVDCRGDAAVLAEWGASNILIDNSSFNWNNAEGVKVWFTTYTTVFGCECMGVLSPLVGANRSTRTWSSSAIIFSCLGCDRMTSCAASTGSTKTPSGCLALTAHAWKARRISRCQAEAGAAALRVWNSELGAEPAGVPSGTNDSVRWAPSGQATPEVAGRDEKLGHRLGR